MQFQISKGNHLLRQRQVYKLMPLHQFLPGTNWYTAIPYIQDISVQTGISQPKMIAYISCMLDSYNMKLLLKTPANLRVMPYIFAFSF